MSDQSDQAVDEDSSNASATDANRVTDAATDNELALELHRLDCDQGVTGEPADEQAESEPVESERGDVPPLRLAETPGETDEYDEDDLAEAEPDAESPGGLLRELEKRQDDVLEKLDLLNARIEAVLLDLGVRLDENVDVA